MEEKRTAPNSRQAIEGEKNSVYHKPFVQDKDSGYYLDNQILGESFEAEKLQKLIQEKKKYYAKLTNDFARKKVQEEILLLQNEILPIVLRETTILYAEFIKFFEQGLKKTIDARCDAMLMFTPISNEVGEVCKVGVINPKSQMFGKNEIESIDVAIDRMGVAGRKIEPLNIELYG